MVIKGKNIILRPIKISDAPRYVKWLNDSDVNKYLQQRDQKLTVAKEKKWIKENKKNNKTKKNFAIETSDHTHIGSVSLDLTPRDSRAVFGIFIGEKEFWNQGLGTDAARTIIDYGFKTLKLHRIELNVMSYNPRAIKVYKRLGFRLEGKKREHVFYCGKYYDSIQMGLLNKEWKF